MAPMPLAQHLARQEAPFWPRFSEEIEPMHISTFRQVSCILAASLSCLFANAALADTATADTVSMNPADPTYFGHYAPELPATVARKPTLDPKTGLSVQEVKPDLFYVTDGMYQSAFLVTDAGVVLFDVPKTFARKLPAVIARKAPGKNVVVLIYSHDHADHIGGSGVFADVPGLRVITSGRVAEGLAKDAYPSVIAPTQTFEGHLDLPVGGVDIQLDTVSYHSESEDVIAYIPKLKFLMAIDSITPGEVPFMNFGATSDFGHYLGVFDTLLNYEFDLLMAGHISILGTRQDVVNSRDYAYDVRDTVLREMKMMFPRFEKIYASAHFVNGNLAYRMTIESMRDECAAQIIDRWSKRMSVTDVWADSHCETAILYYIMH